MKDIEVFLYQDFWELSTERSDPFRPIPWSAIQQYSETIGIEKSVFASLMRGLDDVYLTFKAEQMERKGK